MKECELCLSPCEGIDGEQCARCMAYLCMGCVDDHDCTESIIEMFQRMLPDMPSNVNLRSVANEILNRLRG